MKRILLFSILILFSQGMAQDVIKHYDESARVTTIRSEYDHVSLLDFYRIQPRLNIEIRFPGQTLRNGSVPLFYLTFSRCGKEQRFKNTQKIRCTANGKPFSIPALFYSHEKFNGGDIFESLQVDITVEKLKRIAYLYRVRFNISGIRFTVSKREKTAIGKALMFYEESVIDTLRAVIFDVHSKIKK